MVNTESRTCRGKLNALKSRLRSQLSGFTLYGHNSTDRGISILVKQSSGIVLDALTEVDSKNMLTFIAILPDQTKVFMICVYGPSVDRPAFWESVLELYNDNNCDYRMILGDFNVTLDHEVDSIDYLTDPHVKGRVPLNAMIDTGRLNDTFRDFHAEKCEYTWRTKSRDKRSRLDYILTSPALSKVIKEVKIVHHVFDISDHASMCCKFDITNAEGGKGVFRCRPNLHKNSTYQQLNRNTIKFTIL